MGGRYMKGIWSAKKQNILLLLMQGLSTSDVADKVKCTPRYIQYVMRLPEYQKRKETLEITAVEAVRKQFEEAATLAANKIIALSKDGMNKQKIQLEASKEVLYQIGAKPKEVIETTVKREYTPLEIEQAKETLLEVEEIVERLGSRSSRFIIDTTEATPKKEPIAIEGSVEPSKDRQETSAA